MEQLDIGTKIKNYRQKNNLSAQELASQAKITASMLSQIERNLANPSLNTLKSISQALNVPLFAFFTETDTEDVVVRQACRKKLYNPSEEGCLLELLTPNTNGPIEFCMMHIPAHHNTGSPAGRHNGEEVAFVQQGPLTLTLDTRVYVLETGDSVRIPPQTPHVWLNDSEEEGLVIFAITPPCF